MRARERYLYRARAAAWRDARTDGNTYAHGRQVRRDVTMRDVPQFVAGWLKLLMLLLVPAARTMVCETDADCSLNGLCKKGGCDCFAPWFTQPGDPLGCGRLDTLP